MLVAGGMHSCILDSLYYEVNIAGQKCVNPTHDDCDHTYLKQPEPDQIAAWASRGAGLITDEILRTVRDPASLSAQR